MCEVQREITNLWIIDNDFIYGIVRRRCGSSGKKAKIKAKGGKMGKKCLEATGPPVYLLKSKERAVLGKLGFFVSPVNTTVNLLWNKV